MKNGIPASRDAFKINKLLLNQSQTTN